EIALATSNISRWEVCRMMRAIVLAAVFALLITEAMGWRESIEEQQVPELPSQMTEGFGQWSPGAEKYGALIRRSPTNSKCPDGPDCFVALMGRRSMKRTAGRPGLNLEKFLRDLQNYNLNLQYGE
ncbi:hypothetical protein scyTo_0011712, partial [Scyliorhinus torazame]|nr:hypothetical protein [Scyliorhinus torazame]